MRSICIWCWRRGSRPATPSELRRSGRVVACSPTANATTCIRVAVEARTASGQRDLAGRLKLWSAALPSGMATIGTRGKALTIDSCDPGVKSTLASPDAALTKAGDLLDIHGELEAGIAEEAHDAGAPVSTASCFALDIVQSPEITALLELNEDDVTAKMARRAVQTAAKRAAEKCLRTRNGV